MPDYDSRFAEARQMETFDNRQDEANEAEMWRLEEELEAAEVAVREAQVQVDTLEEALEHTVREGGSTEYIQMMQHHLDDARDEQFAAEAERASAWSALNGPSWDEDEVVFHNPPKGRGGLCYWH